MAYQVGGECFDALVDAARAACARVGYSVVPVSGGLSSVECTASSDPGLGSAQLTIKGGSKVGAGSWTYTTSNVYVLPPQCSLVTWSDGAVVAWGIVTAWVLAFAVLHLRKAL